MSDLISHLTEREKDVFFLIIEGMTSKKVAEVLSISRKTVDTHRSRVMRKLGLKNVVHLVRFAVRQGIIQA